jgi:hypothetical protein
VSCRVALRARRRTAPVIAYTRVFSKGAVGRPALVAQDAFQRHADRSQRAPLAAFWSSTNASTRIGARVRQARSSASRERFPFARPAIARGPAPEPDLEFRDLPVRPMQPGGCHQFARVAPKRRGTEDPCARGTANAPPDNNSRTGRRTAPASPRPSTRGTCGARRAIGDRGEDGGAVAALRTADRQALRFEALRNFDQQWVLRRVRHVDSIPGSEQATE